MPIEQRAYVWFESVERDGDFDVDALTSRLGVSPTHCHRKEEERIPGSVWKHATWEYERTASDDRDWDHLVGSLLDAFDHRDDAVRGAVHELNLSAGLMLVCEMTAEKTYAGKDDQDVWGVPTPASGLTAENVSRLAQLGLSFDADMYVFLPEVVENAK